MNLSWLQLFAVMGGVSAGVVALYLWDRSKRRVVVPTLRFWRPAEQAAEVKHRRRIQQPLSLALQLLSMALLLLALAQPRLGAPGPRTRDHVLILDTSAWMAGRSGDRTLLEQAQEAALAYVHSLPGGDRVMLVRADALATPATSFVQDRAALEQAIADSRSGATALNLNQALEFARQAQKLQGGLRGEVVYAGAGRTADPPASPAAVERLRVLPLRDTIANCGLRRIGVQRSTVDPDTWEILATVRNYGTAPRAATLALAFSGSPAGARRLTLEPMAEQNVAFRYRTRRPGVLEARLRSTDAFPSDDYAALELPGQKPLGITVYSDDPEPLRPMLAANPLVTAVFHKTAEYRPGADSGILIFDRFNPPVRPANDVIFIEPPADHSPVRMRTTVSDVPLTSWRSDHALAEGLRAQDMRLASAQVFAPGPGELAVAEVEGGPVIVAHTEKPKFVALGFHPARGPLRYELTTPLLFANILRWMEPDIFRRLEVHAGSPGTIGVDLGAGERAGSIRVVAQDGTELPYTLDGHTLRFFAGAPGTVRVIAGDREMVYSFTLPDLAGAKWTPPAGTRRGLPRTEPAPIAFAELWPWLALAGALGLAIEWVLFGRARFRTSLFRRPARSVA
ncbi:MAG TPA: BatA and WFA domain-containing protein [Bryobacteraceae bacterium]